MIWAFSDLRWRKLGKNTFFCLLSNMPLATSKQNKMYKLRKWIGSTIEFGCNWYPHNLHTTIIENALIYYWICEYRGGWCIQSHTFDRNQSCQYVTIGYENRYRMKREVRKNRSTFHGFSGVFHATTVDVCVKVKSN